MEDERTAADVGPQAWVPPGRLDGLSPYPLADVPDIKARLLAEGRRVTFFDTGAFMALQAAVAAVLNDPHAYISWSLRQLDRRRHAAVKALRVAGLDVAAPRGTLYLWFPVPTREKAAIFCRRLLLDAGVVLLPGSAMGPGGEGFVRASLAIEEDRWEEAGRRIREAL